MANAKLKEAKSEKPGLRATWREVCHKHKGLMMTMLVLVLLGAVLLIFSLTTLRPQSTVVIVGYGDVYGEIAGVSGGYRRDNWANMLAFPALALIFGLLHNLIALKVYRKYGKDAALAVVWMTMILIAGTFLVLFRLLGEW